MARGPAATLAYGRWQATRLRDAARPWTFAVDDDALRQSLGLDAGDSLESVVSRIRERPRPRFRVTAEDRDRIIQGVSQADRQRTIEAAEAVMRREFTFRGIGPVRFSERVDWLHTPLGNVDWRWDLNRHLFLETLGRAYWYTGDERFARDAIAIVEDWSAANPPTAVGANWTSIFEVAIRLNAWLAALFLVRQSEAFDARAGSLFLQGLLAHGRLLDARLEQHVPNNHLLLEAKALALLGLLMPDFADARRWRERGLRIVLQQVRMQVGPDGVHREMSPHYHRIVSAELLELAVLLDANGQRVPDRLRSALRGMIGFAIWMRKPDGSLPLFSDSALNATDVRFDSASAGPVWLGDDDLRWYAPDLGESELWLIPDAAPATRAAAPQRMAKPSRLFPAGGYAVMTGGPSSDAFLAFDCGPFGYPPMPTHGHADALSFELYADGRSWLVDAGAYSMHLGSAWRNYFRGTSAHNTVVVDALDQSVLVGTRRVHRPATATLHAWLSGDSWDVIDASHDGYERLPGKVVHRRLVVFARPAYWLVADDIDGRGEHDLEVLFHLAADLEAEIKDSTTCRVRDAEGRGLLVAPLEPAGWRVDVVIGQAEPIQGWISVQSGERTPAPVIRYSRRGVLPARFSALIVPFQGPEPRIRWQLTERSAPAAGDGSGLDLEVTTAGLIDRLLIDDAPPAGAGRASAKARRIRLERRDDSGRRVDRLVGPGGQDALGTGAAASAGAVP